MNPPGAGASAVRLTRDVLKENWVLLVAALLLNAIGADATWQWVGPLNANQAGDVLAASVTLLGIFTATVVFLADFVRNNLEKLFEMRQTLKDGATPTRPLPTEGLARAFLHLIVFPYLLLWGLLTSGIATLLSVAVAFASVEGKVGPVAVVFLVMSVVTVLLWMIDFTSFIVPGRKTLDALR